MIGMAINHDFRCQHGHVFERSVSWRTEHVKCECGKVAVRVFLPRSARPENASRFDPVVVFRKRDGTYIFPGRSNEQPLKGTERVELRTLAAVRRFEREENRRLKNIHQESMARRDAAYQIDKREMRSELRAMLHRMSPVARAFAEFAISLSNQRESMSSRAARFDAQFRVDAFSNNRSNRSEFRDTDTGWRARRD